LAAQTKSKVKYPAEPVDVHNKPVENVIFSGNPGSPFVAEIVEIEQKVEEIRISISRYLMIWQRVYEQAQQSEDTYVMQRANNELRGLHRLLGRLSVATT
jgi:hypothetical protein